MQEAPLQIVREGRLPRHAAGLLQTDRGGGDGLVRSPLGRESDARRRPDEDRLTTGVDATVTGLVGAFGGLGGFFPPLELGFVKEATGSYTIGFVLLSLFALVCLAVNYFSFLRGEKTAEADLAF